MWVSKQRVNGKDAAEEEGKKCWRGGGGECRVALCPLCVLLWSCSQVSKEQVFGRARIDGDRCI